MSSFVGTSFEKTPVQSAINAPLIQTVLAMKQGQYDANKAKLQAGLDQLMSIKVLRDEDQEYIQAKMQDLTTKINDFGSVDMSQQAQADDLFNMVKSAAKDPFIQDAIANTKKVNNFNLEVDEIKKKKPELYNPLNYSFSLNQGGVDKYMKGEINDIGSLNYTPYTDIPKEYKEISENLDKYDQDIERVEPQVDENGVVSGAYFITKKGKRLTQEDLKNKVTALLSDGAKKQMVVNGWGLYDQGNTEEEKLENVTQAFDRYSKGEISKAEDILAEQKLNLKNSPTDETYKSNVASAEKYLSSLKNNLNSIKESKNKSQMYTMTYMGDSVNNFSSAFSYDNVQESYSVNQAYQNSIDNAYRINKYNIDNAFREKEFEAKYGENGTERVKAGTSGGATQTKADPDFAPKGEEENFYKKQTEYVDELENTQNSFVEGIYQNLDETTKKGIDAIVEKSNGKLTKLDVLLKKGHESSGIIKASDVEKLDELSMRTTFEKQRLLNAVKQVENSISETLSDEMAKGLYANPNVKIMWKGKDGKERAYPARDVLINNGIVDDKGNIKKSIKTIPQVRDAIEKSILAEKFTTTTINNRLLKRSLWLKNLAKRFGEDIDDVVLLPNDKRASSRGYQKINPNSKTGQYLQQFQKNKMGDVSWSNDSFDDIGVANSYFKKLDPEEVAKQAGLVLAKDENLAIGKVTVVSPKTQAFEKLADLVGTDFKVDRGSSISVQLIPNQPNMVSIYQLQEGVKKGKAVANPRTTSMRIEDLPKELLKEVDFYSKKQLITLSNLPDISVPVKFGDFRDKSRITDLANTFFGGDRLVAGLTTQDGFKSYLFDNFSNKLGSINEPTKLGNIVSKIVADETLQVKFQKGRFNDAYPSVVKKVGNKETILWVSDNNVSEERVESAYKLMRHTPQLLVKDFLDKVLGSSDNSSSMYIKILEQNYAN